MVYTLILANHTLEPHRKKEGDIVALCPHIYVGGRKERKQYFFLLVDFGNIFENLADARKLIVELSAEGDIWCGETDFEIIAKRRYKIDFAQIDGLAIAKGITIDWKKVKDETIDYQPLSDNQVVFSWQSLIYNKASGLIMDKTALETIRDYGKFTKIRD